MFVATLIANPSGKPLTDELVQRAAANLNSADINWLADGIAADIACDQSECESLWRDLQESEIDLVIQAESTRRKRVLLADMDSTMIQQECIDELADVAGVGAMVADITARAMNGEMDFDGALRERVGLLKDLNLDVIQQVLETRITLMPGGPALLATMKANGAYCALVSGGFTDFTQAIAARLGFDENRANTLLNADGKLTGEVGMPILGREAKVEALKDIVARLDISPKDVIAVGDGANDLGMLTLAGSGVALHAKPVVAAQCNIRLNFADLSGLLYLQGYSKSEFVLSI
ncbi:phosphoserine phosphatase SerB [Amylibacter marinus]|uniref:Phosphoserine phosphatase n=1 Tax=Amylibacter marinus TaxID=1475483 RepID=A0ABQ5VVJ9_9RHOB|nr:phosphoserine phosphatase SerB [Amylibacter marinus]GLQ35355.1 phosphoserine phosphatase SerB [Amylibacter marinus]